MHLHSAIRISLNRILNIHSRLILIPFEEPTWILQTTKHLWSLPCNVPSKYNNYQPILLYVAELYFVTGKRKNIPIKAQTKVFMIPKLAEGKIIERSLHKGRKDKQMREITKRMNRNWTKQNEDEQGNKHFTQISVINI